MMKQEFEQIAGYEVSNTDYDNIIEPMYMATSLSKQDFVKTISRKRFALRPIKSIVREMRQIAEHLRESCEHYADWEAKERLESLCREYIERKEWTRYAGHMVIDEMTIGKCYYPASVIIYDFKTYGNLEVITLVEH